MWVQQHPITNKNNLESISCAMVIKFMVCSNYVYTRGERISGCSLCCPAIGNMIYGNVLVRMMGEMR